MLEASLDAFVVSGLQQVVSAQDGESGNAEADALREAADLLSGRVVELGGADADALPLAMLATLRGAAARGQQQSRHRQR